MTRREYDENDSYRDHLEEWIRGDVEQLLEFVERGEVTGLSEATLERLHTIASIPEHTEDDRQFMLKLFERIDPPDEDGPDDDDWWSR
jgi:hypothetical protein